MFKFDFDIDDAEDFEDIAGLKATEPTPVASEDAPSLESFSELSIQQLVRDLFSHQPTPP